MDLEINNLLFAIDLTIEQTQQLASAIARGVGGREVALTITKLQEAAMWLKEGQRVIEVKGNKKPGSTG